MFFISECGPYEKCQAWDYLCMSCVLFLFIFFFLDKFGGIMSTQQTNNTKSNQFSQINIVSYVKLNLPKK